MKKIRDRFINFFNQDKHLLVLLYFLIYLPWFNFLESTVTTHFHVVHMPLDDYIPFCEYFVIPYMLWFGYIAWGLAYTGLYNKSDFYKLCTFLFTGMTLFLVISTVYPNGHKLRPYYFSHHNVFTSLCSWLYKTDTPTNLFPSIHVYNSLGVHIAVKHSRELKNNKTVQNISMILCVSIILATMFIKQHSVFDVTTAIILAVIMHEIIYNHILADAPRKAFRKKTFLTN